MAGEEGRSRGRLQSLGRVVAAGCQDPVVCGTISAVAAPSCLVVCRRIVNDWDIPAQR